MTQNEKYKKQFFADYEKYIDVIYRHCYFRVHSKSVAEDLVQDVFMKTWKYISEGNEIKNMKAFLYRTATNVVIDYVRRKKENVSLEILTEIGKEPFVDNENNLNKTIDIKVLIDKMRFLDDADKEILVMRYLDELSPREISKIKGVSANLISVRINRAKKNMKKILYEDSIQ